MAAKKEKKATGPLHVRPRAEDGKVVLSYGAIVPEDEPGEDGHEWVEEGSWTIDPGWAYSLAEDLPVAAQEAGAQQIQANRAKVEEAEGGD